MYCPMTNRLTTYGGESELLAVNIKTGSLMQVNKTLQNKAQIKVNKVIDINANPINQGYDSSLHLLEIGGGVWSSLTDVINALQQGVKSYQKILMENNGSLISLSHHPFDNIQSAYNLGVLPKPLYDIIRGPHSHKLHVYPNVLQSIYPSNSDIGRGWKHRIGTMAASAQPWNSLEIGTAVNNIATLQGTGWFFNLLTANSPYAEGKVTGKRDYRLEMWGPDGIMSTSRYQTDKKLTSNLPEEPHTLVDYFNYVLTSQRPMVIPYQMKEKDTTGQYKTRFMAIVQPDDSAVFDSLKFLRSKSVEVIDIETGEKIHIKPTVDQLFNGFDFNYFARFGARLRINLPKGNEIDPDEFAETIEYKNESTFVKLLEQAGINNGGFICAEGRVSATVLPTRSHQNWNRYNVPFVLQTAILRKSKEILNLLIKEKNLTWKQIAHTLPEQTNDIKQGFSSQLINCKGKIIYASELAKELWAIAKKSLTSDELKLVGGEIDNILNSHTAPAEESVEFVKALLKKGIPLSKALQELVKQNYMIIH